VWAWAVCILALAGLASWVLAYSGLFPPHPQLPELFSYIGIALGIAALVVAITALRIHSTPAWIAIAAIVVSALPLVVFMAELAVSLP
jgi:sorbitol-specific phosphotransferase system component IIC